MGIITSGQITLEPIDTIDGYLIDLSSDSYVFMGNSTGAPSGLSCTTKATAYRGSQQCPTLNISDVLCPEGIKATITDNNSASPVVTFETTATITDSCEAIITIVVDDVTIEKQFSFAVALGSASGDIIIGGRNLIRNSKTLLFSSYYFTEEIIVTHDGNGNLTWVSPEVNVVIDGNIIATDDDAGNVILSLG